MKEIGRADGTTYVPGECFECKRGEHEDYAEIVGRFFVREPEEKKIYGSGKLCREHLTMLEDDGYDVKQVGA